MLSSLKNLLFNNYYFNPPPLARIRPIALNPDEKANDNTEFLHEWNRSDESFYKRFTVKAIFITLVAIDVLWLLSTNTKIINTNIELSGSIFGLAAIGALSKKYLFSRNAPNRDTVDRLSSTVIPGLVTATLTQAIAKVAISYYQ